jgi:hypothetical protein
MIRPLPCLGINVMKSLFPLGKVRRVNRHTRL